MEEIGSQSSDWTYRVERLESTFQYETSGGKAGFEAILNKMATDGWEYVESFTDTSRDGAGRLLVFRQASG
jgi:hypothetical protein